MAPNKKIQAVPKTQARPGEARVSNIFELAAYSAILGRAQLASVLGMSFDGSRDIYQALGYDTDPTWQQYVAQYARQGFAAAVIDRPVASTWGRGFQLVEAGDDEETQLEKAWKDLEKRLGLTTMFARLDRLTGLGTYGVLLLGLSDVRTPQDFRNPTTGRGHQLKYVRPFSGMSNQGDAQISRWVTDPSNERYGRPELYSITLKNLSTGDQQLIEVHYSRVIHVADGLGSSEIEGTPRLQAVWNNLKNLEKIVGGSAEMYWRGARPGYALEAEKDFQIPEKLLDDLQTQMDEYEHNLRRMLALQGMKVNPLSQQVTDPSSAVDVQIQEMSATTGIPKRILTGSERGELASSQDRENQSDYIEDRQLNFAEPKIIRATVDRFIELGILPPVSTEEGYSISWPDTREPSDKDRADVGKVRADAIKSYASAPTAEAVMPIQSFLRLCLGLTEDEIVLVEEEKAAAVVEEANAPEVQPGGGAVGSENQPAPGGGQQPPAGLGEAVPTNPKQPVSEQDLNQQLGLPAGYANLTVLGGNFGHAGRKGQVGGSLPKGGGGAGQSAEPGGNKRGKPNESKVEWKPSMTKAEAAKWAENSSFKQTIFHGTSSEAAPQIGSKGFSDSENGKFTGNAGIYGKGHYFSAEKGVADDYGKNRGGETIKIKLNVRNMAPQEEYSKTVQALAKTEAWNKIPSNDMYARPTMIRDALIKQGYDSVNIRNGREIVVFNSKNIVVVK